MLIMGLGKYIAVSVFRLAFLAVCGVCVFIIFLCCCGIHSPPMPPLNLRVIYHLPLNIPNCANIQMETEIKLTSKRSRFYRSFEPTKLITEQKFTGNICLR